MPDDRRPPVDPILVEIVEGYLASVEMEVETAIGRTSRSPMIRDAHDFRAGIHDRQLRKLTGRSYSALVHPVVRDYPIDEMRPGDVFFHNDVYLSEGGIGHLPDLCVTAPVFHDDGDGRPAGGGVRAGVRPPRRHRRSRARVDAVARHLGVRGGPDGPADQALGPGRAVRAGAEDHDPQLADARVAGGRPRRRVLGLPDGCAADGRAVRALRARRRSRPASTRSSTRPRETFRREILAKIPDGTYVWEDYAEHDGVDEPRLHTQRITLTKLPDDGGRLVIDFTGTAPQAKGPINHCGDYADGNFLKKWLAPILRNLADTPERMAELDVNEGVVPLIEMRFPPPGTLLTPIFPAPTNARTFVILRLLGVLAGVLAKAVDGRMPADQETIRYTGVYGDDLDGKPYLMREVLGGGSGGRYYADGEDTIHVVPDSRNLPTEFSEGRFPFVVERLGLAVDSGGAGRYRGGCGYEKHIRMLKDAHFMSIADRSILACWGVKGGRAGRPFEVTIDLGGPDERVVDALADAEFVAAGQVIRIRTTGGGGWGDPLERPYDEVLRDVAWGKVSVDGRARPTTASVLDRDGDGRRCSTSRAPTRCGPSSVPARRATVDARRAVLRPRPRLSRGSPAARRYADVDLL